MEKRFYLVVLSFLLIMPASFGAVQLKVSSMNEFKSEKPSDTIKVRVKEENTLGEYTLHQDDILVSKVLKVDNPKRGKRDACFYVQPEYYISDGVRKDFSEKYYGKYSKTVLSKEEIKKMPKGELIEKAAKTVGSMYIKGLGQGISLAEGMIKNEDGNRLKSGVVQVYKDSPLSYVEKGDALDILPEENFYLVFKIEDEEEDKPNYSYTEPAQTK